jgi:transcriptional regulator with GAF, ATPase, and Fis domain/tetratricopeptide (TPR) repeat protein
MEPSRFPVFPTEADKRRGEVWADQPRTRWPEPPSCVGREGELEQLLSLFQVARDEGSGRVALVTGDAGIGKSRLFAELDHRLRAADVRVLEGNCREGTGHASTYHPIAQIVGGAVAALAAGGKEGLAARGQEVLSTLAGRGPSGAPQGPRSTPWEQRRVALFEEVASFLVDVSRDRPLVILVNDLELADRSTRDLIAHLAQTRISAPELEATRTGTDRLCGLLAVSARPQPGDEAWLAGVAAARIALAPLDEVGVRAFLQSPEVVAFFAEASGGRPLALEALLQTPRTDVDELYRARIARLSDEARALLSALSVWGRPVGLEPLSRLASVEEALVGRALMELSETRIALRRVVDGELRLSFQRSSDEEALYGGLDARERARLHAQVGRALKAMADGGKSEDPVAIAEHLLRGAAGEEAVEAALKAGERLEITFGYDRAIDLYRRAHAMTTRDDVRGQLDARLCELQRLTGDYVGALESAERLRRRLPDAAAHRRIAELHVLRDEFELALLALATAAQLSRDCDEVELARVRTARAEALLLAGRHDEAKAECAAILAESGDDADAGDRRVHVQNTLGKVLLADGAYADASHIFLANLKEARSLGRPFEECRALYNLGIAHLRLGDHGHAAARYQSALKVAEGAGDHRNRAFCLQNLGVLSHWKNDYASALDYFHDAVSAFKKIGQRARLAWLALDLASVYLDLNEIERATAMVTLAGQFSDGDVPPEIAIKSGLMAGKIFVRSGELEMAEARLEEAKRRAGDIGDHERRTGAIIELVRVDLERGQVGTATLRLAEVTGTQSLATRARLKLVTGELEVARGVPEAARRELLEALELYQRTGDLEGSWRAQLWLGRAAQAQDDASEAERRFRAALALDEQVRMRVPDEHREAHGSDPLRRALERALNIPQVVALPLERVPRAVASKDTRAESPLTVTAVPRNPRYPRIVGQSARLRGVLGLLDKIAGHDSLVLIRGESGTGKELIADALHASSSRRNRTFVKINCGALVESLLLSELFGHERGAFTGALQRRKGRFEVADGGTIFLDEIGDISPKTQVALLRVLQEREFERVGGTTPVKVDVRILCATNRNLEQMVARGEFREDLYYRLKGIQVELPPLRERVEDIALLADAILERVAEERGGPVRRLSREAVALLERYPWPGNIRELENVVRSVSLFSDDQVIGVRDFADYTEIFQRTAVTPSLGALRPASACGPALVSIQAAAATSPQPSGLPSSAWDRLGREGLSLKELKTRIEIECITQALQRSGGNITRAAERLGMKRPRLSQLIKEHGLSVSGHDPDDSTGQGPPSPIGEAMTTSDKARARGDA